MLKFFMSLPRRAAVICVLTVALGACSVHYIPNTDVEDSPENRDAIVFCERYRKAVEHRDLPELFAMVSTRYYEDGGNVDASDDLDYWGFREFWTRRLKDAKSIRYEIRYRKVTWTRDTLRVLVDYTYSGSYKIPGAEEHDEWRRKVAENRLELVRDGDSFKIISGM